MTDRDDARPDRVSRRTFVGAGLLGGAAALTGAAVPLFPRDAAAESRPAPRAPRPSPFEPEEATIADLQEGMRSGKYTARSLAEMYLARIDELDQKGPGLNQMLDLNPEALAIADQLDAERKAKGPRGPLHGIPVLLKDNIATADKMTTTAGSRALAGSIAPHDAFVARRLREAGAVLLGKTNLSEWANFRSTHSSSGWSGRGGQTHNPYALDRSPSGSSSGSAGAVAANYAAAAIGSETDGSIVSPSAACSVVGIKPTLGLVSRAGVVPIAHSQDTAGPIARTVTDAAILLGAITGVDADDAATAASRGKALADYTKLLDANGLKGARIGVLREKYMGYSRTADALIEDAIRVMKDRGATIVDPANIATAGKWDDSEFEVLLYEFKADLNKYLAWLGPSAPVKSLAEVIAFNERDAARELPYFGQEIMLMAQKKGPLTDPAYRKALAKNHRLTRAEGIDAVMDEHRLDALIAPTQGPTWHIDLVNGDSGSGGSSSSPAAVAGYPSITVPAGYVFGLPVGMSFIGRAWSEAVLIRLAYAYEQATKHRRPPTFAERAAIPANGRPSV
ncbi:MAG TPA: amidase [Gemmatimonadaceae bacterium]|nr:amidase [Gemmatimonadaceae bacterium]